MVLFYHALIKKDTLKSRFQALTNVILPRFQGFINANLPRFQGLASADLPRFQAFMIFQIAFCISF